MGLPSARSSAFSGEPNDNVCRWLRVGDREARADCQCGELIDRIAASVPVRKLLLVEALGHTRVPIHQTIENTTSSRTPKDHLSDKNGILDTQLRATRSSYKI